MTLLNLAIGALVALVAVFLWRQTPLRQRIRRYIDNVSTCGYLAPPPTPRAVRWLLRWARFLAFVQVGKIKIVGDEKLRGFKHPHIVTPNHPHWVDVAVLPILMDGPARYMAARGVFTFAWGLGGLLVGPVGAFCADLTKGKGGPAREAAVKVLKTLQRLVMFPEGWAYLDGKMGPMKKGAVRIAREASEEMGQEVYLFPTFLRYGKYPGSWITKLPPPVEYALVFALFLFYRRGLTMVVGDPVPRSSLSADDDVATEELRQLIVALDPKATKASASLTA